jgi:hypothetical protein
MASFFAVSTGSIAGLNATVRAQRLRCPANDRIRQKRPQQAGPGSWDRDLARATGQ